MGSDPKLTWTVLILLLAAAAFRLPLLDRRPMHADESVLADKFGTLLATGSYAYDPREYHGPMLAYLTWIPAHLTGRTTYTALTETTLRIVPALAGILLALSPLLFSPYVGRGAAIAASAIAAVSPAMIYYSRYFIPEILLALWTALFLAAILRRWWIGAGIAAALMIATKETAILALVSAAIAYAVAIRPRVNLRSIAAFSAALFIGICVFLLPPWKWNILADSLAGYIARGTSAHVHPWYTYLRWLAITEAPILILGMIGLAAAWRTARFLAIYALLLLAAYSAIPYKTPWCAVSPLFAFAVLAGTIAVRARIAFAGALVWLALAAWLANMPYAADPRNPWAYAHTGPGVYTIRDRVAELAGASAETTIDIYTRENFWPLPWYLRRYTNVRWWREVAIPGVAAPIVLVSPAMEPDLVRKLYEGPPPGERELYMNMFERDLELRPGVEVRGYVAKSLWDRTR